jgi:agmatinase
MTKEEKIRNFNPNDIGNVNAGMYGLPFTQEECGIQLIPVPWEVTVSYGGGTADGPEAILEASYQVDLYDPFVADAWQTGIYLDPIKEGLRNKSEILREKAEAYIEQLANGGTGSRKTVEEINAECMRMNAWVKSRALHFLQQDKTVGLLGGDHSTPLGMMQALAEHVGEFGILQIDAHADLRNAYEGFEFSHASIMFNALKIPQVTKLVQVGIRDYCEEELQVVNSSSGRVLCYYDRDLKHAQYSGESWASICDKIVANLPARVYLSFDIDGLDPKLCPHTGTPVAGGFETEQVLMLLEKAVRAGKKFIGFDLNEVSPGPEGDDWDANVAARLLYRIANLVAHSQGRK